MSVDSAVASLFRADVASISEAYAAPSSSYVIPCVGVGILIHPEDGSSMYRRTLPTSSAGSASLVMRSGADRTERERRRSYTRGILRCTCQVVMRATSPRLSSPPRICFSGLTDEETPRLGPVFFYAPQFYSCLHAITSLTSPEWVT
jgi:hypothetical protein